METQGYLIETRLQEMCPRYAQIFKGAVLSLFNPLESYTQYFPEYTDHSELHALTVINYCNILIGKKNVERLNEDELLVLLLGCYLHDIGMGIKEQDLLHFCTQIDFGDYFETHDKSDIPQLVRTFHHEFSACFVRKYAALFDLPSEEHIFAVGQVCRGHRKVDLFDENEYPQELALPNGNTINMPYLAAIVRLADELDVASERVPRILYDASRYLDERQLFEYKKHMAVKELEVTRDAFILHMCATDQEVYEAVVALTGKLQNTLDYCASVINKRTPYEITQKKIIIQE